MEDLRLILPTIINKIKNKKNGSILLRKHARDDQHY